MIERTFPAHYDYYYYIYAHYDRTYFPVLLYIIHTMIERTFQHYYI